MFCSKCGASLVEGAQFCGTCGEKQGGQNNPAPTPQTTTPHFTASSAPTAAVNAERKNKRGLIYGLIGIALIIFIVTLLPNISGGGSSRTMVGLWELSLVSEETPLGLPATITFVKGSTNNSGTGYYVGGVTNMRYDFTWSKSGIVVTMSRFPGDQGIIASMGTTEVEVDLSAGELTFWYPNGSWVEYTKE